jgi:hypothetical protein
MVLDYAHTLGVGDVLPTAPKVHEADEVLKKLNLLRSFYAKRAQFALRLERVLEFIKQAHYKGPVCDQRGVMPQ